MPDEKIPLDLRYLPERQAGEEPITDKQITLIVHLTGCEAKVLQHLGKLQATGLIEHLLQERDEMRERDRASGKSRPSGKKTGWSGLMVLLMLGGVSFLIWKFAFNSGDGSPSPEPELAAGDDGQAPSARAVREPASSETPVSPATPVLPEGSVVDDQPEGAISSFEAMDFPVRLVVLSPVVLLDPAGKEATIPADTELEVVSRKEGGTLTIRSASQTLVGNEIRILGKVRRK
jgi:hypothetical protein